MNHLDNGSHLGNKSILKRSNSFREANSLGKHDVASGRKRDGIRIRRWKFMKWREISFYFLFLAFMVAAIMTQWNASTDCWDWGMGWGWAGWSASYCDTCALEHAAIAAHVASSSGHATQATNFSEALVILSNNMRQKFKSYNVQLNYRLTLPNPPDSHTHFVLPTICTSSTTITRLQSSARRMSGAISETLVDSE